MRAGPASLFRFFFIASTLGALLALSTVWAQPASSGLSGLIHMPNARMEDDGLLSVGFSYARPYSAPWVSVQVLPFLQVSGRYTRIHGASTRGRPGWEGYGDVKDKSAAFKLRLIRENAWGMRWMPELSAGMDDFHGTQLFRSDFIAASKRFDIGPVWADTTVGYGRRRIGGLFGGARIGHRSLPSWALVTEYDATRYGYGGDSFARTGMSTRRKGAWGAALEYRWNFLHLQAGRMHGQNVFNVALSMPLQKREYVPKIHESGPLADGAWASALPRPTAQQWHDEDTWRLSLVQALHAEGLRDIRLAWRDGTLALRISSERYRYASRGIGRAALLALSRAPIETQRMEITWETLGMAGMTWEFYDVSVLQRYFAGTASRQQLAHALTLRYADPAGRSAAARANDIDAALDELARAGRRSLYFERNYLSMALHSGDQSSVSLTPYIRSYLNDPSGAFKYDIGLNLGASIIPARGWRIQGGIMASLRENVSDVSQRSNSLLPHVRSDLAEYRRASRVKLDNLTLNRYWQPAARTWVRGSIGLYEEMYAGVGGQLLYLHRNGRLAADLAVDVLRQRNYKGTGFHSYRTVTAIGSVHYRLPWLDGVTATVRAGRFLARDHGVRFELSRTFRSGIQLGMWYTRTNGNDVTSPGRPGSPYFDKGVFMRIPLAGMATRDTATTIGYSLAPWNRDVGQMVTSPGDLYQMHRKSWLDNVLDGDGLRSFSDVIGEDTP